MRLIPLLLIALLSSLTPATAQGINDTIFTDSTSDSNITSQGNMNTTITQPPPSAISPQFSAGSNSDSCTIGVAGAVQTQILGISAGTTYTEDNCIRLKNAKVMYDMGMKVAAVSTMCQDRRVFDAMWNAGTPCPYEGVIGEQARVSWNANPDKWPKFEEPKSDDFYKKTGWGALLGILLFSLF